MREHRVDRLEFIQRLLSWPAAVCVGFVVLAWALALTVEPTLDYAVGQRVEQPIYARVEFSIPDPQRTEINRQAARAATPSYYQRSASSLTSDRVRADLKQLYQLGSEAETFELFAAGLEPRKWSADPEAYSQLRRLAGQGDAARVQFETWTNDMPLEDEYVVRGRMPETRDPASTAEYLVLIERGSEDQSNEIQIPLTNIVRQTNERAMRGSASQLARRFPFGLRSTVEQIVEQTIRDQPTIVFNAERTQQAMRRAESTVPEASVAYEKGKPFIAPSVLGSEQVALLHAHHEAYLAFMKRDGTEAALLRMERRLQRIGLSTIIIAISVGLLIYARANHPRLFQGRGAMLRFAGLVVLALVMVRVIDAQWPHVPVLVTIPVLFSASVLPIVYPRRFAIGVSCILVVLANTLAGGDQALFITMLVGAATATYQLHEIRSRTKLITSGVVTAVVTALVAASAGFVDAHDTSYVIPYALWAGSCALCAAFLLSGVLPFVESLFRVATSLTLLEWRDPTRPLLALLSERAPGTYNHSLALGTLAQAACEPIGCNGLLAQVGALYHDIGKIWKAEYFAENQMGTENRHDRLAPSMSLLIIVAHVKDGLEMARDYKLPRVLHQFIGEHHGTTVVRYFHHVASEQQPRIASGKHDREVSEAGFRYPGPQPRSRESAVVMICDGVEGAVRALDDPTPGRIEGIVNEIVGDRLEDGQFDECDITLRELHEVEESLVKSLCALYHGRVAYPKSRDAEDEPVEVTRVGVS